MNAQVEVKGVLVDEATVSEAESLGIDVVRACEAGLRKEIERTADVVWIEENRAAMGAWNEWLDKHGMPFAEYRVV